MAPGFLVEFGVLYHYYLMYVSNIMKTLYDYHTTHVDDRVLN